MALKDQSYTNIACKGCYGYLLSSILHPSSLGLKVALNYGYLHSVVSSALFRAFSVHAPQ